MTRGPSTASTWATSTWIATTLPGDYEGDDDLPGHAAINPGGPRSCCIPWLGWLREALALNTADDEPDRL